MTHLEMQELLPLYALDALPDDEDIELRIHVETCPECAHMLQQHLETAGLLAAATDPVAPSPELRNKILEQVKAPAAKPSAASQPAGFVKESPFRRWFPAAALALLVAIASLSAVLVRQIGGQKAEIQEQRRLLALVSSPTVEVVPMSASSSSGISGRAFVDRERDTSGMVVRGLPDPGEGIYALWLIESGKPKLVENFAPDRSGSAVMILDTEIGADRPVAVTLEPRPDTQAPEGPILLQA